MPSPLEKIHFSTYRGKRAEHYFHTHYSQSPFLLVFEQCDLNIFYQFMKKKSQLTLFLTFSGIVSFGLNFKKQKSSKQCPSTKSWKIFLLIQFDWEENAKTKSWKWVKKLKGTIVIPRIILRWIILHWDPPFKCPQLTEMSSTEMSSAVIRYDDYNSNTILLSPNTSWNKKLIPKYQVSVYLIQ